MNDEFIIRGLDYNPQENTKQSAIKFLNNFMSIEVDEKLISTAYQKGTITTKLTGGKMVKIPKITVVKTTTNVCQTALKNMTRLKGKRHPMYGYGYYVAKNQPEVV